MLKMTKDLGRTKPFIIYLPKVLVQYQFAQIHVSTETCRVCKAQMRSDVQDLHAIKTHTGVLHCISREQPEA